MSAPADAPQAAPADALDTPAAGGAAIRGGGLRLAAYVGGMLLGLASVPVLYRHLGVVDFGRYVLVTTLVALAAGVSDAGLTVIAQREYVVRTGAAREALVRNMLGLRIALTALVVAIAALFGVLAGYESELVVGTLVAGFALLLLVVQNLLTVSLTTALRFGWVTALEFGRQAIFVVLVVILVLTGAGLLPLFAAAVPASVIVLAATVALVRGLVPLRPSFSPAAWWDLIKDSVPFAAATAIYAVYLRVSIVILAMVATALETGYYATSYRIVEVLVAVPALLVSAAFPIVTRAAEADEARFRYAVERIVEVSIILGAWLLLMIEVGAELMIAVLAGEKGAPAVGVLRIQGIAVLATFLAVSCAFPLLALRQHRALLIANGVALAASVSLTFALGAVWGAKGAATATVAAEVSIALVMGLLLLRARPGLRLAWQIPAGVLVAALLGAAVALGPGLPPLAGMVVATVVYFGLLAWLGRIPPELADAVLSRLRRSEAVA